MPEITIRYDDDSDNCPHRAIAAILEAAGDHLALTDVQWARDTDEEPAERTLNLHFDPYRASPEAAYRAAMSASALGTAVDRRPGRHG